MVNFQKKFFFKRGILEITLFASFLLPAFLLFFTDVPVWYGAVAGILFPIFAVRAVKKSPILVIGSGIIADKILGIMAQHQNNGYGVIHFRWDKDSPDALAEEWARLATIFEQEKIKKVVVALDDRRKRFPMEMLLAMRVQGVCIMEGASFYEEIAGRVPVEFLKYSDLIFRDGFERSDALSMSKRGFDIFFSVLGLLVGLPLIAILAVLIKIDSSGPIFYSQERVGRKGKTFQVFKLRTMVNNAEQATGPVYANQNDSRVTRLGHFMRKYRLDEIPQMFNVLNGAMSFVGPRPERPVFVKELREKIPYFDLRITVKPGITGWAQIRFSYSSTLLECQEKFEHDLYYIKHVSPMLDLKIIINTVRVLLTGQGAR